MRSLLGALALAAALAGPAAGQSVSRYASRADTTTSLTPPTRPDSATQFDAGTDFSGDEPVSVPLPPVRDPELVWWESDLTQPILRDRTVTGMPLPHALQLAVTQAPELRVLQSDWQIRQQEVCRQDAAFDWTTFIDAIWNRDSTPVGSDLDGAAERLRSRTLTSSAGIRRLTHDGTEVRLAQGLGLYSGNSVFINPNYQGNSRLVLEFRKPLFRGAGELYNTADTRLAQIDQEAAYDRLQAGIQDHLLQVASAYWNLVLRRGRFLQSVTAWIRTRDIVNEMQNRVDIDITPAMLERSQLALKNRLAMAIEAEFDVVRAQDALLRLIYGMRFTEFTHLEILTTTLPRIADDVVPAEPEIQRALRNRSEIHEAIRRIKASSLELQVARNEVQPVLDMILTGYSAGLEGNNNVSGAFRNQFNQGEPGVGIGFSFELPHQNRAARAGAEQAHLAVHRMQSEFEATISVVTEDVRNQVIQRNKFSAMLPQYYESLKHADLNLKHTETRRRYLTDGTDVADLYLENLLQMQSRLTAAEYTYLQSQISCSLADSALSRAVGVLPMSAVVSPSEQDGQEQPATPVGHSNAVHSGGATQERFSASRQ